ncbi:prothrombin-like [Ruditapes philippinarum]|uniref:prothrombin-like n=1 Tax=Ruditapes philippinarum TaxID=129788 RepID=UPI00295AAB51|nr:prothrombin-like [Ruditapes philippinarum]
MTPVEHVSLCLTAVMLVLMRTSVGLMSIRTDEGLVNVALNKDIVVANVSDEDVGVAVDGKRSSCIIKDTGHDIWWRVDLGDLHTIFDIRVKPTEEYFSQKYAERKTCHQKLRGYEGTVSTTVSGRTCQRWDQQKPHKHTFHPENFWYRGSDFLKNNYCRVPNDWIMPWCFTTDPGVEREYCDVWVKECVNG